MDDIAQKLIKPESLQYSGQSCCQTQQPRPAEVPKVHSPEMEPAHKRIVHAGYFGHAIKIFALKKGAYWISSIFFTLVTCLGMLRKSFPTSTREDIGAG